MPRLRELSALHVCSAQLWIPIGPIIGFYMYAPLSFGFRSRHVPASGRCAGPCVVFRVACWASTLPSMVPQLVGSICFISL